jgi:hypothetical protein
MPINSSKRVDYLEVFHDGLGLNKLRKMKKFMIEDDSYVAFFEAN